MTYGPRTSTISVQRRRPRRRPVRFALLVLTLVVTLLLLGFQLWEIGMAILVRLYLGWCFKS